MKKGLNIYREIKTNQIIVYVMVFLTVITIITSFVMVYFMYKRSTNNLYTITTQGELIPLQKVEENKKRVIEIKANFKYFLDKYYNLNAYNMKNKQEEILWLVGQQPTKIIKSRIQSGYFDEFLSINGLMQEFEVLEKTVQVSGENPYYLTADVLIRRINNKEIKPYISTIKIEFKNVDRNYPYNPYGLIITQFSENIQEYKNGRKDLEELQQNNEQEKEQAPKP